MTQEPQATLESEKSLKRHWFKHHFYRKEGNKDVLDLKKCKWFFLATALCGLLLSFIQGTPIIETGSKGVPPPDSGPVFDFPLDQPAVLDKKAVSPGTGETKGKKAVALLGPQLIARPKVPIPPAAMIKARLVGAATDGPVRAEVMQNLFLHGEVAVQNGSVLLGTGSSTEDRLLIRFSQMIDKEGRVESIQAQAFDKGDQTVGLKGSKIKSAAMRLGGSIGLNFLSGLSEGFQETEVQQGVAFKKSSVKNALLQGTSRAALDQSKEMVSEIKNTRPAIRVGENEEMLVGFDSQQ